MNKWLALGAGAVLSVVAACSGSPRSTFTEMQDGEGGRGGSFTGSGGFPMTAGTHGGAGSSGIAGSSGTGGSNGSAGSAGASSVTDPRGPVVTITSPLALDDPGQDGVLVDNDVTVVCLAKQSRLDGTSPVDPSTVSIEMLDANGMSLEKKPGVATGNGSEYSASFVLTNVPNGKVGFRCKASDSTKPALANATTNVTFVDHGPTITFKNPIPDSAHSLEGALAIEFTVDAAPLASGDDGAEVDTVALTLNGVTIPVTEASDRPGTYLGTATLTDMAMFSPPPSGATTIQVIATDKRAPHPGSRLSMYNFSIDSEGPVIAVTSPTKDKIVVGGNVLLQFKITDDPAGVDEKSVVVSINEQDYPFDATNNWTRTGDNFTFKFDSANVQSSKVQVTINIRASDKVGNASPGTSLLLYLDNKPPIVDLDPANIRERNMLTNECSVSFDPVGDLAVNDLDGALGVTPDGAFKHYPINIAARFRAFVFEDTNRADGISIYHYAGTDASKVRLYVQPNPATAATPLLVDKDGDGICDEIGDVDNINFSVMDKVTPAGVPRYGMDPTVAPVPGSCVLKAANTVTPLCSQTSDMWHVLTHDKAADSETLVYSVKVNPGLECAGIDWEFGAYTDTDGWVCFAVRAVDNVGNVGVSRPLRVCMDDPDRPGEPACKISSTIPPNCTDGCTPPPRADLGILSY